MLRLFPALLLPVILSAAPPPNFPGQLIPVNGHKLHIDCQGTGSPAVILESGAGEFSTDWTLLQPSLAKLTRVCAFDRAGIAWSDPTPTFEHLATAATDLHLLLAAAGLRPPYILVGHAMGTLFARDYQRRFPTEVAGLVLLDPTPEEDFQVKMFGNTVSLIDMADHDLVSWPVRPFAPSRTSPPPTHPVPGQPLAAPFDKLPNDAQNARQWALQHFFDTLDRLTPQRAAALMESERATFLDLYNARHNPATSPLAIPVTVLSRSRDTTPEIARMQDEQAALSRNAVHRVVPDSGTQIHIEQPAAVAQAISEMVEAVRKPR